MKNNLRYATEV